MKWFRDFALFVALVIAGAGCSATRPHEGPSGTVTISEPAGAGAIAAWEGFQPGWTVVGPGDRL